MNQEKPSKQIVVFDFDDTLTQQHLFYALQKDRSLFTKEWTIEYIFGGQARIDRLLSFFAKLLTKNVDMAISSHGNLFDIKQALIFAGIPLQLFVYIQGTSPNLLWKTSEPEFKASAMYNNKVDFIERHLQYKDKYDHVVFIDDDEPNSRSKYYDKLSLGKRRFKNRMITTIIMDFHNPYDNTTIVKGINEVDQESILKAVDSFNTTQKGGMRRYKKCKYCGCSLYK